MTDPATPLWLSLILQLGPIIGILICVIFMDRKLKKVTESTNTRNIHLKKQNEMEAKSNQVTQQNITTVKKVNETNQS